MFFKAIIEFFTSLQLVFRFIPLTHFCWPVINFAVRVTIFEGRLNFTKYPEGNLEAWGPRIFRCVRLTFPGRCCRWRWALIFSRARGTILGPPRLWTHVPSRRVLGLLLEKPPHWWTLHPHHWCPWQGHFISPPRCPQPSWPPNAALWNKPSIKAVPWGLGIEWGCLI